MNDVVRCNTDFSDEVFISKKPANCVVVEGKQVPVITKWGKNNFEKYPALRVAMIEKFATIGEKLFGMPNPTKDRFFGTESIVVEKYKEVYVPGIGNDAVYTLSKMGYNFREICAKIGKPVLTEVNIHRTIKSFKDGWINLMLNEGIDVIFDLITENNDANYYTNLLARVGVGNDNTAALATQTGLLGGSTAFEAMEVGFPNLATAQRVDFKGSFADGIAEFAWEEFTVDNGNVANHNLQRLVSAKGTKSPGEVWTAEIQITGA